MGLFVRRSCLVLGDPRGRTPGWVSGFCDITKGQFTENVNAFHGIAAWSNSFCLCEASGLNCRFCFVPCQVVRKSQVGAARRRHPQPPAVVQAGTGPPRARGGAGQNDPLPQTGPRYIVFTARNNSCRRRRPHLDICLRGSARWHVIVSRDTLRAQNVSGRIPAAISNPQASPSVRATESFLHRVAVTLCSLLKVPERPTSPWCDGYYAVRCRSSSVGRRCWQKGPRRSTERWNTKPFHLAEATLCSGTAPLCVKWKTVLRG